LAWSFILIAVLGGLAWPRLHVWLRTVTAQPEAGAAATVAGATAKPAGTKRGDGQLASAGGGRERSGNTLRVASVVLQPRSFVESITSTGTLRAEEGVELQAETSGKIVSIAFREGAPVRKGALLVKLNDSDLRANVTRFTEQQKLAQLREERYATLLAKGVVTRQDYDNMASDVSVQRAQVELYQAQIEKTEIRAPFDGVVGLRYVSDGAYVNAATRIATLQRLDHLKIDFAVPEKYTGRVRVGDAIRFAVAGGQRQYTARIYAIDPRIDAATRTLLLRAVADNTDRSLLPGAFANVTLELEPLPAALLVPAEAVIPGIDEKNVFVMEDGVARRRVVELGSRTSSEVHVLRGLKPGERVITSGTQQLRDGQAVAPLTGTG
jgi:membrane fusion protein (multidrug efflux system)